MLKQVQHEKGKNGKKIIFYLIILSGFILTLLPYLVDGRFGCFQNKCGFIWGTNYRDGIWFLAISNVSFQKFPFLHPTFAGEILKGYHFLPNFFVFLLSKLGISPFFSYFKIIPFVYFILITFILVILLKTIKNDLTFVNLGLFFFYFGIPFTLLTSIINRQPLNNGLLINTFQATRILESPHTAFGLILIFLTLLWIFKKEIDKKWKIVFLVYFFSFGIKFYVAVTLGLIFFFYLLIASKENLKKSLENIFLLGITSLGGVLIFLQPDFSQTPTFNFSPFATVHHLIESENLFYNKDLVLSRYYLYEHGFSPRLLLIELYSLFLFVVFYLGTRFFGLFYLTAKVITKKANRIDLSIFFTILIIIFLSTFFVQRGDWFNPIQFFVPASYILSIYSGLFFYQLFKKSKLLFFSLFFLSFIFTFIPNLINLGYPKNPARFVIPQKELEALNFLKNQPFGYVFSPQDENDTSYVAAFSYKPTYLNFITINQTLGVDYQERLKLGGNPEIFNPKKIKVQYFYLPKDNPHTKKILLRFSPKKFKKIFENEAVIIYNRLYE